MSVTAQGSATPFQYAPYYCEENAALLSARPELGAGARSIVFVTNPARTVPMMQQRAAEGRGPVVWDYHVVVLVEDTAAGGTGVCVWDLDCVHGMPLPAPVWLQVTFPWVALPEEFEPVFRLVDAEQFRSEFSSDRSHMLVDEGGDYRAPLPPWERLGTGASNLAAYLDLEAQGDHLGQILNEDAFRIRVGAL